MKVRKSLSRGTIDRIAFRRVFWRLLTALIVVTSCANAAAAAGKDTAVDAKSLVVGSTVIEKIRKTGMDIQAYYSEDGNAYAHFNLKGQERAAIIPYYFKGNKVCQHFRGPEVCVQFVKQNTGYVTVHDSGKIGSDIQIKKGDVYGLAPHVKQAQQEHKQMKTQQEELADKAVNGLKAVWGLLTQRPPTDLGYGRYECQDGQVVTDPSTC